MSILLIGEKDFKEDPNTLIVSLDESSIGVEVVKEIIHFVSMGNKKTVVVKDAEKLTEEAQNALLKTLEEPPNDSEIVLQVKDDGQVLETIRSRCIIVYGKKAEVPNDPIYEKIKSLTIQEKLTLAKEKSLKRDEARKFIDSLLVSSKDKLDPKNIRLLFKAKKELNASCNPRLAMENMLLNW